MKCYEAHRDEHQSLLVTVNGDPLNPRFDLRNHSPTGFECGYGGSGPAQLALALLADHLGDTERAISLYQQFKWQVVATLPKNGWTLRAEQIDEALQLLRSPIE